MGKCYDCLKREDLVVAELVRSSANGPGGFRVRKDLCVKCFIGKLWAGQKDYQESRYDYRIMVCLPTGRY